MVLLSLPLDILALAFVFKFCSVFCGRIIKLKPKLTAYFICLVPYDVEVIESRVSTETGRRIKLPCHRPDTDVSLWNILKKNIGKDLSKVAMPVTLNEPLNALQVGPQFSVMKKFASSLILTFKGESG